MNNRKLLDAGSRRSTRELSICGTKLLQPSLCPNARRILHMLAYRYHCRHGTHSETTFAVFALEKEQALRIFRGTRRRRSKRQVKLWLRDTPDMIQESLEIVIF